MISQLILGLMRLDDVSVDELEEILEFCLDNDIDRLDVADIYGNGESERKLGEVFMRNPSLRSVFDIQTKCGIVTSPDHPTYYDSSYEHIIESVSASMKRMHIGRIESLLIHRPDIFMDVKEIAHAFDVLSSADLVSSFGVSNMDVSEIEYIRSGINQDIEICQLQLGVGQAAMLASALNANNPSQPGLNTDGLYFYLKKNHIQLQCWSPYQVGYFEGSIFTHPKAGVLRDALEELAKKYNCSPCGIATSFLTSLSPDVSVVIGSLDKKHILESIIGSKIRLTRQDWYYLYTKTGNILP